MKRPDFYDLEHDAVAEWRRDRDHHREPRRSTRPRLDLRARREFQASVIDKINELAADKTTDE